MDKGDLLEGFSIYSKTGKDIKTVFLAENTSKVELDVIPKDASIISFNK